MAAPPTTGPRAGRRTAAPQPPRSFLAELPVLVLVAFILALLLKTFLVQAFYIPSESMVPTLEVGDRVLVNKVVYSLRDPERGEVVVFRDDNGFASLESRSVAQRVRDFLTSGLGAQPSERDFIKRIIGLPGETIEVDDGLVYINGVPLEEDLYGQGGYLREPDVSDFGPQVVPEGSYFMMGDNRRHSADSRTSAMGAISRDELLGRAFVIIWPLSRVDTLPIFGDLGITAVLPSIASGS
jgi:signal peptidase I